LATGGTVSSTGTATLGNVETGGTISSTGTATLGNVDTGGAISATGNITGGNIATAGTSSLGNIVISGDDITDVGGGVVNINTALADVDFAVSGDTTANIFFVDAGTETVSIGSATQTTGAVLAMNASTSFLSPVGNTAQRPVTGVTGMMRFNTTLNAVEVFDNTEWVSVGVQEITVITDDQFAGDDSTVAFTLSAESSTSGTIVAINGIQQIPTTAYSVSGTTLTFTEAPATGDVIDCRILTTTTSVTSIVDGSSSVDVSGAGGNVVTTAGGTAIITASSTNVTIDGDLTVTGNAILSGNIVGDRIQNGTTTIDIQSAGGNANVTVGGTSNVGVFHTGGFNVAGDISATGDVTAQNVNSLSDAVLKTNISMLSNPESIINQLFGYEYDWKNGSGHSYGLLAQDVEKVLPDAVRTGNDGLKSVNYMMIIPFLVETIKKLASDVADLKK